MKLLLTNSSLRTFLQMTSKLNTQLKKLAAGISRIASATQKVIVPALSLVNLIRTLNSMRVEPRISLKDQASKALAIIRQKLRGLSKTNWALTLTVKDKITNGIKSIKDKFLNLDSLINGGKWLLNATLGTAMQQNPDSGASKSWSSIGNSVKKIKGNLTNAFTQIGVKNLGKLEEFLKRIQTHAQKLEKLTGGAGFQKFVDAGATALTKLLDAGIKVFDLAEKLGKWLKENKEIVIPLLSGIAAAVTVFGVIIPLIAIVQGLIAGLIPVIAGISWPILAVVAAVAAVVAIWRNWDTITQVFTQIKDNLVNTMTELITSIKTKFNEMMAAAISLGRGIVDNIVSGIKQAPGKLLNAFKGILPDWVVNTLEHWGFSFAQEKPKSHASGLAYVPYDNYPALLHRGEQVLTRVEADQYRRGNGNVSIAKLADTIVVREEADINRIAAAIAARLKGAQINYGVGVA